VRELLIGCGRSRDKRVSTPANPAREWADLTCLDHLNLGPPARNFVQWDLNRWPLPFDDNLFTEIHAYEVLEHLGRQGDVEAFFGLFTELWRILTPSGYLAGTCPSRFSPWLWGDPSHSRAVTPETLLFLSQPFYTQCDAMPPTPCSDYRDLWRGDFEIVRSTDDRTSHVFVLQAIKPARVTR